MLHYSELMRAKLGLAVWEEDDPALFRELFRLLAAHGVDYHLFLRRLGEVTREGAWPASLLALLPEPAAWQGWLEAYRARLAREGSEDGVRKGLMDAINPKYVLRNALAQRVIEAAEQGDMAPFERLFAALQHPMMSNPNTRNSLLRNRHGIAVASSLAAVEEQQMNWRIAQTDREAGVVTLVNSALDWDSFPTLAEALLQEWELVALERECGADRHSWLLEFEGSRFRLEYEHYSGCWLAAELPAGGAACRCRGAALAGPPASGLSRDSSLKQPHKD